MCLFHPACKYAKLSNFPKYKNLLPEKERVLSLSIKSRLYFCRFGFGCSVCCGSFPATVCLLFSACLSFLGAIYNTSCSFCSSKVQPVHNRGTDNPSVDKNRKLAEDGGCLKPSTIKISTRGALKKSVLLISSNDRKNSHISYPLKCSVIMFTRFSEMSPI